jgi:uncharacterized NAD(P)/FAD-binding protein YdhS
MRNADSERDRPVLIIGGGFSGTLLTIHLRRMGVVVTLFERDPAGLAKGLAYGTRRPEHLLNVRASNMSAFPDDPGHFLRWLGFDGTEATNRFVPRLKYGEYLRELLMDSAGPGLTVRADHVVDVVETPQGVDAVLSDGTRVAGRTAVLALGNFAPRLPGICAALPETVAFADPWRPGAIDRLDPDAPVLLLGTGLTAIDVILALDGSGHRGPIMALSRRGQPPRSHLPAGPACQSAAMPVARGSLLLQAVRARAARVGWRVAIDELRPHMQNLWRAHGAPAQARFLRHLRPWWDAHRHRLAPQIAARIEALQRDGALAFAAGRVTDVCATGDRATVQWRPRGQRALREFTAARVINCIGPEGDIRHAHEPLLQALLARGAIRPDAHRLGLDVDPLWRVCDQVGVPNARIHAIGPLTKGAAWEIIAVPEIRQQVWTVAQSLAGQLASA